MRIEWSKVDRCWLVDGVKTPGVVTVTGTVTFIPNGGKGYAEWSE